MRSTICWLSAAAVVFSLSIGGSAAAEPFGQAEQAASASKQSKKKPKKKSKKRARTWVKVLTTGQNALVRGRVKVRVKANRRTRARVKVFSNTFDDRTKRRLTKGRVVRFAKRGRKIVRIRLTERARTEVASCQARRIKAITRSGKSRNRSIRNMKRQRPDCQLEPVDLSDSANCDFIAQPKQGRCMMPFPNDFHTAEDSSTATGKRIDFRSAAMPENTVGKAIDPAPYSGSDGFSQGQGVVLKVPGIDTAEDVAANGFVPLNRLSAYAEADQKAVVIDTETGERWPIWVEIDANASDPDEAALLITPAVNFDEKGRYIVALRNLTDGQGAPLEAPNAFRYYRDAIPSGEPAIDQRREHFEGIFKTLRRANIKRSELYLAWDFTVASNENNYRRALHMRDEAFKVLGDTSMADNVRQGSAPGFTVLEQPGDGLGPDVARRVRGTFTVPCFLTNGCQPGGVMDLDGNGLPKRNGNYEANFQCIIPPVGLSSSEKLRPFVYGHGLLGDAIEVVFSPVSRSLSQDHKMIACATNEIGMAAEDVLPVVAPALTDLSSFNKLADRLQQGLLNELFLARLMYHPDGLGSHPAFQNGDGINPGDSVIRTDHVYYVGASQGGIMGGPLTALSPDFIQSALVVGAMNYSTLLTRSSNWDNYGLIFNGNYADELSRPLILNIIQMLWDRGEPNGYAHLMTDNPPPNTPKHNVTLQVALGDHQVSNFNSDIQARTNGLKTNAGGIDPNRWPDYEGLWNIPRIQPDEYPYRGSSIIYWDGGPYRVDPNNPSENIGTGTPPYANVPPNGEWEDPHGAPRGGSEGPVSMMNTFLRPNGYIEDVCNGQPCRSGDWDGDFGSITVP